MLLQPAAKSIQHQNWNVGNALPWQSPQCKTAFGLQCGQKLGFQAVIKSAASAPSPGRLPQHSTWSWLEIFGNPSGWLITEFSDVLRITITLEYGSKHIWHFLTQFFENAFPWGKTQHERKRRVMHVSHTCFAWSCYVHTGARLCENFEKKSKTEK